MTSTTSPTSRGPTRPSAPRASSTTPAPGGRSGRQPWRSPPSLAELPPATRRRDNIDRQTILDRAQHVTTELDALELYLLVSVWDTITAEHPGWLTRRPLQQKGAAAALLRTYENLRTLNDPVKVYRQMHSGGANRIPYLGPSFFTKWLYFAGYDATPPGVWHPLSLDARVARTLGLTTRPRASTTYAAYLDVAHQVASELGTTPYAIEHALFTINGGPGNE